MACESRVTHMVSLSRWSDTQSSMQEPGIALSVVRIFNFPLTTVCHWTSTSYGHARVHPELAQHASEGSSLRLIVAWPERYKVLAARSILPVCFFVLFSTSAFLSPIYHRHLSAIFDPSNTAIYDCHLRLPSTIAIYHRHLPLTSTIAIYH